MGNKPPAVRPPRPSCLETSGHLRPAAAGEGYFQAILVHASLSRVFPRPKKHSKFLQLLPGNVSSSKFTAPQHGQHPCRKRTARGLASRTHQPSQLVRGSALPSKMKRIARCTGGIETRPWSPTPQREGQHRRRGLQLFPLPHSTPIQGPPGVSPCPPRGRLS